MNLWPITSGLFLGWALGSNDAANIFGTGVATNMVKFRTAVSLIAIFVVIGALVEGPKVMATVGNLSALDSRTAFISTLAAAVLVTLMSKWGIPVSTSQAIIGAVLGVGLIQGTANFAILGKVVVCWLLTPVGGILFSILFYKILARGLSSQLLSFQMRSGLLRAGIIIAGSYGAYALGSNNVANVTGVYVGAGLLSPFTASLIGSLSIAAGAVTYSKNVMYTVGKQIVPLEDFSAFVVVVAQAATVHIFSQVGVPVSASQAVVGAVLGIGLLQNVRTISTRRLKSIFVGWLLTPVLTALFTIFAILIFRI